MHIPPQLPIIRQGGIDAGLRFQEAASAMVLSSGSKMNWRGGEGGGEIERENRKRERERRKEKNQSVSQMRAQKLYMQVP